VEEDSSPGPPLAGALLTIAGVVLAAGIVLTIHPLNRAVLAAISGDTAEVRDQISELGLGGPLIILALQLIHAVVFYPAELIDAAAGFAYGFVGGFVLVQSGWVLSGLLSYAIGHWAGRPLLHRLLGSERFERIEAMVERGGVTLLLTMRLLPIVPFSLVSTAAGTARVPLWRFTWTTAVGYAPITAIAVYLGTRLENFSFEDPTVLLGIGAMLALIGVAHWLAPRRKQGGN
jgi:uncharacterized membrane protein YdjX (TVP38/TMEM64 family)